MYRGISCHFKEILGRGGRKVSSNKECLTGSGGVDAYVVEEFEYIMRRAYGISIGATNNCAIRIGLQCLRTTREIETKIIRKYPAGKGGGAIAILGYGFGNGEMIRINASGECGGACSH